MNSQTKIEKADPSHLDELENLYNTVNDYLAANTNYPGWLKGIYPIRKTAEKGILADDLYILTADGRIAGSVILNHHQERAYQEAAWNISAAGEDIWVVHTLVVHPDFLHHGIGRRLLHCMKAVASYISELLI